MEETTEPKKLNHYKRAKQLLQNWAILDVNGFSGRICDLAGVTTGEIAEFSRNWIDDHADPNMVGERIQDELFEVIRTRQKAALEESGGKLLSAICNKGSFIVAVTTRPDMERCAYRLEVLARPHDRPLTLEMLRNAGVLEGNEWIEAEKAAIATHQRKLFNDREAFEIERYAYRDRQRSWWRRLLLWLAS